MLESELPSSCQACQVGSPNGRTDTYRNRHQYLNPFPKGDNRCIPCVVSLSRQLIDDFPPKYSSSGALPFPCDTYLNVTNIGETLNFPSDPLLGTILKVSSGVHTSAGGTVPGVVSSVKEQEHLCHYPNILAVVNMRYPIVTLPRER